MLRDQLIFQMTIFLPEDLHGALKEDGETLSLVKIRGPAYNKRKKIYCQNSDPMKKRYFQGLTYRTHDGKHIIFVLQTATKLTRVLSSLPFLLTLHLRQYIAAQVFRNYRERKIRRNMLTTNPMQGQVRCCQIWGRRRIT